MVLSHILHGEPRSGSFVPHEALVEEGEAMPWE